MVLRTADASGFQNRHAGALRDFPGAVVVNPHEVGPTFLPIITHGTLLANDCESIPFQQSYQLIKRQGVRTPPVNVPDASSGNRFTFQSSIKLFASSFSRLIANPLANVATSLSTVAASKAKSVATPALA